MPRFNDTMYHRSGDIENEILRDRLKADKQAARDISRIIGNPVTGRYLSMEEVQLIQELVKKITK